MKERAPASWVGIPRLQPRGGCQWWFSCSQAVLPDDDEPGSGCADEKRTGKPCDCGLDQRRLAVLRCVAAAYMERPEFKAEWRIDA